MTLTHNERRVKICLLCYEKKSNVRIINDEQAKLIKERADGYEHYEINDIHLPSGLCQTCIQKLRKCDKSHKFPQLPLKWRNVAKNLRSSSIECNKNCKICSLINFTLNEYKAYLKEKSNQN